MDLLRVGGQSLSEALRTGAETVQAHVDKPKAELARGPSRRHDCIELKKKLTLSPNFQPAGEQFLQRMPCYQRLE